MKNSTRRLGVLASMVAVLMVGGIAFAYWTATGTGTGAAATGSSAPVVVKQTSTVSNIRPGGAPQTLSGNFDNPNDGPVYITRVVASIASVTKAANAPSGTCDASDYVLADATMALGRDVPAGTAQGSWTGAKLSFNNKADANQDACKGATVNLAYAAS